MASINSVQDSQVTYLSGLAANGTLASQSYWTWASNSPATYDSSENYTAKFGPGTAGTGATISYAFDPASNWSDTERAAFSSTAALWSAVANVRFVAGNALNADVVITRASDGTASGGQTFFFPGTTGTTTVGRATDGVINIDTSVAGFGPLGAAFTEYGGYPYTTLIHEWGHVLGLGHGGPYDDSLGFEPVGFTSYDTLAWTIMSYVDPSDGFQWGASTSSDGYRYANNPVTPMMLDIVAIQRLYGVAVDTPLSGGQVYGFNSNIGGEIGRYFDFSQNAKPIVTLWNKGTGNSLDLSGFSTASTVDLHDGSFSSAAGLTRNIAIAYGTRIDSTVTGSGDDSITGNDNGNRIMGSGGSDSIMGGAGNDHLYGAAAVAVTGDGADTVNGGAGNDYIQGNAGDDRLDGGIGSDRVQGGQGNDSITGGLGHDSINGNLGNDSIDGGEGNDSLRGGQGSDSIMGGTGNDGLLGDLGADSLTGSAGIDILTGGGDADVFVFETGDATFATSGALAGLVDMITDFTDGLDRIDLAIGVPSMVSQGGVAADFTAAAALAQQMLDTLGLNALVTFRIGNDSFLFYDQGPTSLLETIKLEGILDPGSIGTADFI